MKKPVRKQAFSDCRSPGSIGVFHQILPAVGIVNDGIQVPVMLLCLLNQAQAGVASISIVVSVQHIAEMAGFVDKRTGAGVIAIRRGLEEGAGDCDDVRRALKVDVYFGEPVSLRVCVIKTWF